MVNALSPVPADVDQTLTALRLKEEQECAGYLAAHKAMRVTAAHTASMRHLAVAHPNRLDYVAALDKALANFQAATERTELAYADYQRAQMAYDVQWTETMGRMAGAA